MSESDPRDLRNSRESSCTNVGDDSIPHTERKSTKEKDKEKAERSEEF